MALLRNHQIAAEIEFPSGERKRDGEIESDDEKNRDDVGVVQVGLHEKK